MMGIDKSIKEAENYNSILKASQEHSGDQVMLKQEMLCGHIVARLQKERCCTAWDTHCSVRERESGSLRHPIRHM